MITQVIVRPVLTEKATQLVKNQVYTFEVSPKSNKNQIAVALEKMFKVKVADIRIVSRKGKMRRVGRTMKAVMMPDVKIAYVQVSEGKIDLFPQA